ncbi:MAG: MFS transporter [Verrucomicrobiales bacterium]|nr:MFS transporter [Verrucomicrobiales bacterium]
MDRNIPLFIVFRLLFNARFYYPIFAVIQLDYGLTMSQFALLNAIWAVSIVLLEVPSGALADRIGRKRMVVLAAALMVVEMAVIAFVPFGNVTLIFWAWVINRVLSGAAEAAASGADEALAYDSIPEEEQKARWPKVLSRLMTLSSMAFIVAMLVGSAVYDPNLVNKALTWIGSELSVEKETVIRFPIYLTLITGIAALIVSLFMKEPKTDSGHDESCSMWGDILEVGKWILKNPFVYALILAALVHDSVVRIFLTTASEYYRLIDIPVVWFGVIGAAFAGLGIFTPKIAEWLVLNRSIRTNYLLVTVFTILGLFGISLAIPHWGVAMVVFFGISYGFLNFFGSHYLNAEVDSKRRATVLSFRGLALNLGFGAVSLIYGGILRYLRNEGYAETEENNEVFRQSLHWLPWVFFVFFACFLAYYFLRAHRKVPDEHIKPGTESSS